MSSTDNVQEPAHQPSSQVNDEVEEAVQWVAWDVFGKPPGTVKRTRMICQEHQHYKGIMLPALGCVTCEQIYKQKHANSQS